LFKVSVLSLTKNVNEINTLHKDEELLEIQTSELQISFKFAEDSV